MPTVRLDDGDGYRFFFYSNENAEPAHVHVSKDGHVAKFWLTPVRLAVSHGFAARDLRDIQRLVEAHRAEIEEAWHEHFRAI